MNIDRDIEQISQLRREADQLHDDNLGALVRKIELLVQMRTLTGRVSAWLDECYERTKNERRKKYAEAFIDAGKYREAAAELAIADLRDKEATALGMMKRYQNGLKSLTEEINYLKLKARMEYGGGGL